MIKGTQKLTSIFIVGLLLVNYGLFQPTNGVNEYEYTCEAPKPQEAPVLDDYEEIGVIEQRDLAKDWVNELEWYESNGIKDKDNYKRVDVNGYYSYSCLQFQMKTFLGYYNAWKKTNHKLFENITLKEARNLMANCDRQKQLATWMIKNNPNNWKHWRTSVKRGLGLPPIN